MTTITGDNHTNHQPVATDELEQLPSAGAMPHAVATAAAADDGGPDPDMPFFQPQQADRLPPPPIDFSDADATLSVEETLERAELMLKRIFMSPAVRLEYYNRSRSWHKKADATGRGGGDFERQWLRMLAAELPGEKGVGLNTNDFGNIHQVMFLALRRAMLAVTGHDPHPFERATGVKSFHFIPNDTSSPGGTHNPPELGFPLDQP